MIKQLFINSTILLSALFIFCLQIVRRPGNYVSPAKFKVFSGIIAGITAVVLILFGVPVSSGIVVDFRYITLILSSIYIGPLATVIGALITSLFRVFYNGVSYESIIGGIFVLTAALGCSLISKIKVDTRTKWILIFIYTQVNSVLALLPVIPDISTLLRTFIPYSLFYMLLTLVMYYYCDVISVINGLIKNLEKESERDFLTELNNVRNFDKLYNHSLQNAHEKMENLSIMIVDIDYFKRVNDTYGHQAGDAILKQLGAILRQGCRNFDIVSRNGGEEFSIILLNCSKDAACEIAERIRRKVEDTSFILPDGRHIKITISAGVATYPETVKDNEALLKNADKALYRAKNSGRNRVCYYGTDSAIYCHVE